MNHATRDSPIAGETSKESFSVRFTCKFCMAGHRAPHSVLGVLCGTFSTP